VDAGSAAGAWEGGRLERAGGLDGGWLADGRDGGWLEARLAIFDEDRGGSGGGTGRRLFSSDFSGSVFCCVADGASPSVFFLCSRQHSAHRHSTTKSPFLSRRRESRHPNCALMSV
jgi:hypothetical protein